MALAVLWPQPRQAELVPDTHLAMPVEIDAPPQFSAPAALLHRELTSLFGPAAVAQKGATTIRLALEPERLVRPEEYAVEPMVGGVLLRAHDAQGAFWAVHTLAALLGQSRRTADGYQATIPKLRDWPDVPFRAFMIQGAWTHSVEEFKRNLELLARQHVTYFALEFGPQVVLDFDPKIAEGGRFTKAQAREIIDYGRSLGLKPIAYLELLGHLERAYKKEPYTHEGGIDIRSDAAYEKFVYPLLTEMLDVYGPVEYFHCGMDEAWELFRWLSKENCDAAALLARHIERINRFLKARDVKMVIWHDMLTAPSLAKELGAPAGPANGGPPQSTAPALLKIPKDVVLNYWFYDPLARFPGLDYLRRQGFDVWASPWQTPFSFVRYARDRNVPTMGTLWTGPPGCFGAATYSPVTAFYAQAAWNAAAAPNVIMPEPSLRTAAQRATSAVLWRRRSLDFPATSALLLSSAGARRIAWPAANVEQHFGVPLDTSHPLRLKPLPAEKKSFADASGATSVLLPGKIKLSIDGVNIVRGDSRLVLYRTPKERTGTNTYGVEVAVSSTGTVLEVSGYGSGDRPIPAGGFVLSAHSGSRPQKADQLEKLRPGDHLSVLDAHGDCLGGYVPTQVLVVLPRGLTLRIDGEDTARSTNQLVLYRVGRGDGHTGTNQYGVEVAVRSGRADSVRDGVGNMAIPGDGFVLSAHDDGRNAAAEALRTLRAGDAVKLLLDRGGRQWDLTATLAERRKVYPVGARCSALYLAVRAARGARIALCWATGSCTTPMAQTSVFRSAMRVRCWPPAQIRSRHTPTTRSGSSTSPRSAAWCASGITPGRRSPSASFPSNRRWRCWTPARRSSR